MRKGVWREMKEFIKCNWDEYSQDVLQISIETILDSPIIELPWVKGAAAFISSMRDRALLKKLCIFMYYGQDIGLEERCKFLQEHTSEDGRVDEKIIILLDSIDSNNKIKYLSNIFRAAVRADITWDEYQLFNNAIKNLSLNTLYYLRDKHQ